MSQLLGERLSRRSFAGLLPLLVAPLRRRRAAVPYRDDETQPGGILDVADLATSACVRQLTSAADLQDAGGAGARDYNIMDPQYGAIGDGVSDDGPAIARAERARQATGGRLLFPKPPVAFRVATRVTVDADNVHWQGTGSPEIRCAIPSALDFVATAGRAHLRLDGITLSNYHNTAFQPCLSVNGTGAAASWEDVYLNLTVDGRDSVGEGVHLRQVYEGDVQLFSQHGPECLLRHNAEQVNSGNVRYRMVGNSVGAIVAFLNSRVPGITNTLLNSIQFDVLKGVTGTATYYSRTAARGSSAAGQSVLVVDSTTGMRSGQYVTIAGVQYAKIEDVPDDTHLILRDNLQVEVINGDHVIASSFVCVAGPATQSIQAIAPHQESTGVGFWCAGAQLVTAYGMLLGSGTERAMLCTNGATENRVLGVTFPGSVSKLTLLECLDHTTRYNELMGWYNADGGAPASTVSTDSTGTATNRAARSLYELSANLSFDTNSAGVGYRNPDSTITIVLDNDGTHTHLRSRTTGAGVQVRVDNASGTNAAAIATDTGAYFVQGTQVVGDRISGWSTSSNGTRGGIDGSTATLSQVATALAQLLADLATHGLIGP